MKHNYSILAKAFAEMQDVFTSQEFNSKAIELGYPLKTIKHRGLHEYLKKHATNGGEYSKTWRKNGNKPQQAQNYPTITEMIAILKERGYKILRPVSQWEEV